MTTQTQLIHQPLPDVVALYLGGKKVQLNPSNLLGEGGEGRVHEINGTACKVYWPDKLDNRKREKLRILHALQSSYPDNVAAPQELLYNDQGTIQGYQMPLVGGQVISELWNPKARNTKQYDINALHVLISLLTTLQQLHRARIVIGDLNPNNVKYEAGKALLIDFDSAQVMGYPCEVGVDQYRDPTVIRYLSSNVVVNNSAYSPQTDFYAFAVIALQALAWVHPRTGIANDPAIPDNTTSTGLAQWYMDGKWWVYSRGVIAPVFRRDPQWLDPDLFNWFQSYFTSDERPTPTAELFEQQLRKVGGQPLLQRLIGKPAIHPKLINHNQLTGNKANIWGDASGLIGDCSRLSGDVTHISGVISIWGRVKGLTGNISPLRGDVSGIWGDCSNISGDCTGLNGNVTNISGDVSKIRGEIHVTGNVSKLSGDISLLWGDLGPKCRISGDATGCQINVSNQSGPIKIIQYMLKEMGFYFGKPKLQSTTP